MNNGAIVNSDKGERRIYLDNAASTPVDEGVILAMESAWREAYANPYSSHNDGEMARGLLESARETIGKSIGVEGKVHERNLAFTSGGTESNALALRGVLERAGLEKGFGSLRFLTSPIEHPSVLEIGEWLERRGGCVDFLEVGEDGIVTLSDLEDKVSKNTVLASLQLVNSEIGTIQPVSEFARRVKKLNPNTAVHSDASQALLWMPVNVEKLGVDLLTIDAHKLYGPKGIGALYVRKGIDMEPLFYGASGKSIRPGTPSVPLAIGFAEALRIADEERENYVARVRNLRDWFFGEIERTFPRVRINGSRADRVVNNISITFPGENHEFLQVVLDEKGVSVATRSACLEAGGEGSEVVAAISRGEEKNALRISLGRETEKEDLESVLSILTQLFEKR